MALRTTQTHVSFSAPFRLPKVDEPFPARIYDIDTDEGIHEGNDQTVYLCVSTLLHLDELGWSRTVTINSDNLGAALRNDREKS